MWKQRETVWLCLPQNWKLEHSLRWRQLAGCFPGETISLLLILHSAGSWQAKFSMPLKTGQVLRMHTSSSHSPWCRELAKSSMPLKTWPEELGTSSARSMRQHVFSPFYVASHLQPVLCGNTSSAHSMWQHILCPFYTATHPLSVLCGNTSSACSMRQHILCPFYAATHPLPVLCGNTSSACSMWQHILCPFYAATHPLPVLCSNTSSACSMWQHILCLFYVATHPLPVLCGNISSAHSMRQHILCPFYAATHPLPILCGNISSACSMWHKGMGQSWPSLKTRLNGTDRKPSNSNKLLFF